MSTLIEKEAVLRILRKQMEKHIEHMNDCKPEEERRYYSNQTCVMALDDVINLIKKL